MPAIVRRAPCRTCQLQFRDRHTSGAIFIGKQERGTQSDHFAFRPARYPLGTKAPFDDDAVEVGGDDGEVARTIHDRALPRFGGCNLLRHQPLIHLRHDLLRQNTDRLLLHVGQRPRAIVEDAQRPDGQALRRLQQDPGVEA